MSYSSSSIYDLNFKPDISDRNEVLRRLLVLKIKSINKMKMRTNFIVFLRINKSNFSHLIGSVFEAEFSVFIRDVPVGGERR